MLAEALLGRLRGDDVGVLHWRVEHLLEDHVWHAQLVVVESVPLGAVALGVLAVRQSELLVVSSELRLGQVVGEGAQGDEEEQVVSNSSWSGVLCAEPPVYVRSWVLDEPEDILQESSLIRLVDVLVSLLR